MCGCVCGGETEEYLLLPARPRAPSGLDCRPQTRCSCPSCAVVLARSMHVHSCPPPHPNGSMTAESPSVSLTYLHDFVSFFPPLRTFHPCLFTSVAPRTIFRVFSFPFPPVCRQEKTIFSGHDYISDFVFYNFAP